MTRKTVMVYYYQSGEGKPFVEDMDWLTKEGDLIGRSNYGGGDEEWYINGNRVESYDPTLLGEYEIDVPLTPGVAHTSELHLRKQS